MTNPPEGRLAKRSQGDLFYRRGVDGGTGGEDVEKNQKERRLGLDLDFSLEYNTVEYESAARCVAEGRITRRFVERRGRGDAREFSTNRTI